ncbi:helix-turn-helix domain-containing protein [Kitasatospora sp. NPDC088134]|uniref:helix-turn-helix domain-containing protein n=1 Tax=Kitasatospora sp. NPDC088134 TaxID=3364071 RepID=UPI0038220B0F
MHIHRSAHARHFTVLPNEMLQRADLSLAARGLLGYLLSRPDGWRETAEELAKRFRASLGSIRRALRELTTAGYYHVVKTRMPQGRIVSVQHVHDVPRPAGAPGGDFPAPGAPEPGGPAPSKTKEREKETPLPPRPEPTRPTRPTQPARPPRPPRPPLPPLPSLPPLPPLPSLPPLDDRGRDAVAALLRAVRPEPRLRIGQAEAERLAPLVARWLDHGSTASDLAAALLPGLPERVHSPAALLRRRLTDKLPPAPVPRTPPPPTCPTCHDLVPRPGPCTPCTDRPPAPVPPGTGPTRAREALRLARETLRHRPAA